MEPKEALSEKIKQAFDDTFNAIDGDREYTLKINGQQIPIYFGKVNQETVEMEILPEDVAPVISAWKADMDDVDDTRSQLSKAANFIPVCAMGRAS